MTALITILVGKYAKAGTENNQDAKSLGITTNATLFTQYITST